MEHSGFLKQAIKEAFKGFRSGEGGPFGAIVVKDGRVIGRGHNSVLKSIDPTAHAEVNAIREACRNVNDYHLTGATLYTNFEPCPMCLSAIYWADIRKVYFCSDRKEAESIGFMDNHLYLELSLPKEAREVESRQIVLEQMEELKEEWNRMDGKILY